MTRTTTRSHLRLSSLLRRAALLRAAALLPLPALLFAAAALLEPSRAEAQCGPGSFFCAGVHVGGHVHVGAHLQIGPPPPVQAQVVVVHQAPPPPPPVVYVQPVAPPPTVVYVAEPAPQPTVTVGYQVPVAEPRATQWGLHGHLGGIVSPHVAVGGMTGAVRLRPEDGHLAIDLGLGAYAGQDYNGLDRVEVPMTADLLLFLNPQHRLQVYGVAGLGFSFAHAEGWNDNVDEFEMRDFAYFGGQAGAGLELRLGRFFALNGDVRGMLRSRIDDDPSPEFVETDELGRETGRTTNTSTGLLLNLGATVYF